MGTNYENAKNLLGVVPAGNDPVIKTAKAQALATLALVDAVDRLTTILAAAQSPKKARPDWRRVRPVNGKQLLRPAQRSGRVRPV